MANFNNAKCNYFHQLNKIATFSVEANVFNYFRNYQNTMYSVKRLMYTTVLALFINGFI